MVRELRLEREVVRRCVLPAWAHDGGKTVLLGLDTVIKRVKMRRVYPHGIRHVRELR